MSANPTITANDVVKYISQILNVDVSDRLTFQDMLEDLASIQDLAEFRIFVKTRFNYERFRYLSGYQKFLALANEFRKENKPKLSIESTTKALTYSENLFRELTRILDEVNMDLQVIGKSIDDVNFEQTLLTNGMKAHHIEVLRAIGDKKEIIRLMSCKYDLMSKIEAVVLNKTLLKEYPSLKLENKNKVEAVNVIEQLKERVK